MVAQNILPSFDSFPTAPPRPTFDSFPDDADKQIDQRPKKRRRKEPPPAKTDKPFSSVRGPVQTDFYPRRPKPTELQPVVDDPKPDKDNIRYSSLYVGDVPRFRRKGKGRVLGLHLGLRIIKSQQSSHRDLTVLPSSQHRLERYTDKHARRRLFQKDLKAQSIFPEELAQPESQAYIQLLSEDMRDSSDEDTAHVQDPAYRSLGNASRRMSDSDSDSDANTNVRKKGRSYAEKVIAENARLSSKALDDPEDVDAWLTFVDYQDEYLASSRSQFQNGRTAGEREERKAVSDGKLTILDKAIELNKRNPDVLKLVKARLKLCEAILPLAELDHEWRRALKKYAGPDTEQHLWVDWFAWKRREGRSLKIQSSLVNCVKQMLGLPSLSLSAKLDVFAFAAYDMATAGYRERAVAMFQAMMELNFCMPTLLRYASLDEQLDDLETFWESEAPRFGEKEAKGWNLTDPEADVDDDIPPVEPERLLDDTDLSGFFRWAAEERRAASKTDHPAKLVDSAEDDDLYRVVLFADIRIFLFVLPMAATEQRLQLLSTYLATLGLSFVPVNRTTTELGDESFIRTALNSQYAHDRLLPMKYNSFDIIGGEPMETTRRNAVDSPATADWHASRPFMFDNLLQTTGFGWPATVMQADRNTDKIRAALQQIDRVAGSTLFKCLWIAVEALHSSKDAVSLSKRMLSADPHDILLWLAFAQVENFRGRLDAANKVFKQTLAQVETFPLEQRKHAVLMWTSLIENLILSGNLSEALNTTVEAVFNLTGKQETAAGLSTAASRLRARNLLEERLRTLDYRAEEHGDALVYLLGLLSYLELGLIALDETVQTYVKMLPLLKAERLRMRHCKLHYIHATSSTAFQPHLLSQCAAASLEAFPSNSTFFASLFYSELRTRIQNRVRRTLDSALKSSTVSTTWLFKIECEMFLDSNDVNKQAIQYVFDRAIAALRPDSHVSIWSLYLQWVEKVEPARLKPHIRSALLEAAEVWPACKDVVLVACQPQFSDVWRRGELRALIESLEQREMRILVNSGPFIAIEELDFGKDDGDDATDVDPALAELADRKRLMPF